MGTFQVGRRLVHVAQVNGRWHVRVGEVSHPTWFCTEAEAWAAGVREAQKLDEAPEHAPAR